jgi:hypothetical protein
MRQVDDDTEDTDFGILFSLYEELDSYERIQFFKLIATICTAEEIDTLIFHAPPEEWKRYAEARYRIIEQQFSTSEIDKETLDELEQKTDELNEKVAALNEAYANQKIAEYKSSRNRKSSPKTIRRNVEICDLRKQNRRKWSLTQLAKHFKTSQRSITLVLSEEAKWRNLLSDLPGSK